MSSVDMKNKGKACISSLLTKPADEVQSKHRNKRVMKNENGELQNSGCSLYMFASLHYKACGYVLYKIDYNHLSNNYYNEQQQQLKEVISTPLMPFLVFYPGDLPHHFCSLVHMGDYLYFVGQEQSDVFKIAKSKIKDLFPSEHNLGSNYLKRLEPPMNSRKYRPIVFVAKDNLYVISSSNSHEFEMYSPTKNSWTVLNYRPSGPYGPFKSHVVLDDTVYFATSALDFGDHDESVFSYNVTHKLWKVLTTSPCIGFSPDLHPTFEHPILPIGNLLFGGFSLPPRDFKSTVAASPYTVLNDSDTDAKTFFMRPTLAPQPNFWHEFFIGDKYVFPSSSPSYYITDFCTLEGENVLCFVSYGNHPRSGDTMAFFNFFKITGDICSARVPLGEESEDDPDFCYYARQVDSDSKHAVKSYFISEFMHCKLFKILTEDLLVYRSRLITCFSY